MLNSPIVRLSYSHRAFSLSRIMFQLKLLGTACIEGPRGFVPGRGVQRRRLALLAVLAIGRGRPVNRDKLLALFWPDADSKQARHLFSDSIYLVRRELSDDAIVVAGDDVCLNPRIVASDVAEFEQALDAGDPTRAVESYGGSLLDGTYLAATAEFEHWLDVQRARLAGLYAGALESLALSAQAEEGSRPALEWWQRLAAHDPCSSRIALRLMRAHIAAGDPGRALRNGQIHERLLFEELGVRPDPDVMELMTRLTAAPASGIDNGENHQRPVQNAIDGLRGHPDVEAIGMKSGGPLVAPHAAPDAAPPAREAARDQRSRRRRVSAIVVAAAIVLVISASLIAFEMGLGKRGPADGGGSPRERRADATITQVTFDGDAYFPGLSPDGRSVAYWAVDSGIARLLVRDVAQGRPIEIYRTTAAVLSGLPAGPPRWSPTGDRILFTAPAPVSPGVMLIPRFGGEVRVIGAGLGPPSAAAWSPDGSRVAVAFFPSPSSVGSNQTRIAIVGLTAGETHVLELKRELEYGLDLDWSPTGNRLALLTLRGLRGTVWTLRTDGSDPVAIVEDSLEIARLRWNHRGDGIVYLRKNGPSIDLMEVPVSPVTGRATGPGMPIFTGLSGGTEYPSLSLSADGGRMVYTRTSQYSNLYLVTPAANPAEWPSAFALRPITTGTSLKRDPSFAPDGHHIAVSIGQPARIHVGTLGTAAMSLSAVSFLEGETMTPAWSPDGLRIAFAVAILGDFRVWISDHDGANSRPIATTRLSPDVPHLEWCDDHTIIYHTYDNRNYGVLDIVTGVERPLVARDMELGGWMFSAACSPDAESVAAFWWHATESGDDWGLWRIARDGSAATKLADGDLHPIGWSPDGRWIYALKDLLRGGSAVVRVVAIGGEPEPVFIIPPDMRSIIRRPAMTADARNFSLAVLTTVSDIVMVERRFADTTAGKPPRGP